MTYAATAYSQVTQHQPTFGRWRTRLAKPFRVHTLVAGTHAVFEGMALSMARAQAEVQRSLKARRAFVVV